MLTRNEMEEILSRHYDDAGLPVDDAYFESMSADEVTALFEEVFPDEGERQAMEKSIREYAD